MTATIRRKAWLVVVLALLLFVFATIASAQDDTPDCPGGSADYPTGCADIYLSQDTMLGDFYLDDELISVQSPGFFLTTSVGTHQIDVRNIQSTEEGFGELFIYEDASTSVYISQGQIREVTITPRKTFIRGTLDFTCDIHNVVEGDSVACQVAIDGVPQAAVVAAGETTSTILDPGDHTVTATLVGEHAGLWAPASAEKTFTISEGKTAKVSLAFDKRAHLTVTLDQAGVLADFYIDDELIAAQVASIEQWLAPNKTYTVEARNVTDPAAQGLYEWKDAKTSVYLTKAQEKALELKLQKNWLKGFYEITCDITDLAAGDQVHCLPTIDAVPYDPILPGETASYSLDPGSHSASVAVGPEGVWQVEPKTHTPYITGGKTTRFTASFRIHIPTPTPVPTPTPDPSAITEPTAIAARTLWAQGTELVVEIDLAGLTPGTYYIIDAQTEFWVWPFDGSDMHQAGSKRFGFTATTPEGTFTNLTLNMSPVYCDPGQPITTEELWVWIRWQVPEHDVTLTILPFVHTWCVP